MAIQVEKVKVTGIKRQSNGGLDIHSTFMSVMIPESHGTRVRVGDWLLRVREGCVMIYLYNLTQDVELFFTSEVKVYDDDWVERYKEGLTCQQDVS